VDLLALVAEEAPRTGASVSGEPVVVPTDDARMLRRLVRNLLENARRHGGGAEVEATVERAGARRAARRRPRPGRAQAERERILPDARLDVVLLSSVYHHVEDRVAYIYEPLASFEFLPAHSFEVFRAAGR
jgi:signal transduction histidine kinase